MHIPFASLCLAGFVLLAASCALHGECKDECAPAGCVQSLTKAVAVVMPTEGNTAKGLVRFTEGDGGVHVTADITGLAPNSKHGFHIHQWGDCSSANGSSAGGHYNPDNFNHAGPDAAQRHAGDLGNLESDAQGHAHYDRVFDNISICGARNPVLGRGVIVHAAVDDFTTQPTGNAGARIGCGVIGAADPAAQ